MRKSNWGFAGIDSAPMRQQRASYIATHTTDEAIALGLVKVQKVPPAYVGSVLGADRLPQANDVAPLPKGWTQKNASFARGAASARNKAAARGPTGWSGRVVNLLTQRGDPMTVAEISAVFTRRDRVGDDWLRWLLAKLCGDGVVVRNAVHPATFRVKK